MLFYFKLHLKRFNRHLIELGFNPAVGVALGLIAFVIISLLFFNKIESAQYWYTLIALSPAYALGNSKRNQYLKTLFTVDAHKIVRLLENFIAAVPFIIIICYQKFYLLGFVILSGSLLLSFFSQSSINSFALPTPFYKKPFEFITGFRKSVLLILGCYTLAIIGISVDNFNLAVFALIVVHFCCLNFYSYMEPLFYVWVHAYNPTEFLWHKISIATFHSIIISLPISVLLLLFYPGFWYVILAVLLLALLYLILTILGKYAYYPTSVNLFQLLAVAFSIIFPPFLLISLPFFYVKAKQYLLSVL